MEIIRNPRWDLPKLTSHGVVSRPPPSTRTLYNCCISVLPVIVIVHIEPRILQLINETCTRRYSSTSFTCWRMCQCRLHAVLWSPIGKLMRLLAAEHRRIEGLLFLYQCLCGTIFPTQQSMVWGWKVLRAGQMLFYQPLLITPFLSSTVFPFSSFFLQVRSVGLGSSD